MKTISIVTTCFNEEDNVQLLYEKVKEVFKNDLTNYNYEHIFVDNSSVDSTVDILKDIAKKDKNVKIIVNSRNFGHIRSGMYALLQANGDAVISLVADFQDPPSLIPSLIKKWEEGNEIVVMIKKDSEENKLMFKVRNFYYTILDKVSEVKIFQNFTGFGLYDRKVMKAIDKMNDPYPFFRGMIAEVGYKVSKIQYSQPVRTRGVTKNNFYTLYDIAMLGIINNSKIPLRITVFLAALIAVLSFFIGLGYFIVKLIYWDSMSLGIAPVVIGGAFAFSTLLFIIGIIGEYIGAIYTQTLNRPLIFEKERINFD
jgi:glycosyltransferase involved in cell wall biosynthesis